MIDNYDLWEGREDRMESLLSKCPECSECGERIQDEQCYRIGNEFICEACMDDHRIYIDEV